MAEMSSQTSFEKYNFTYKWTISDLLNYIQTGQTLKSPEFSSPAECNPKTVWWLEVYKHTPSSHERQDQGTEYMGIRLLLKSCESGSCWVKLTVNLTRWPNMSGSWDSDMVKKLHYRDKIENNKLAIIRNLKQKRLCPEWSTTLICCIYVYMYDVPKHKVDSGAPNEVSMPAIPEHNLGQIMEGARQNGLLTDVTLVTGEKQFKAHKCVLSAQSPFFKTCFEERWERPDKQIELHDVAPEILEALLKHMYTGKVEKLDQLALKLFSTADEYGLEKLQKTCGATLAKNLSAQNVVDVLILADIHNASELKKACLQYITRNPSQVQKSPAWSKLEAKSSEEMEKLRIEVLEASFKSLR